MIEIIRKFRNGVYGYRAVVECSFCHREFDKQLTQIKNKIKQGQHDIFCSRACYQNYLLEYGSKKRIGICIMCKTCDKEFESVPSLKSKFCSHECYAKNLEGKEPWNKGKGKSSWLKRIKASREWKEWREAIFARDDYTCQWCRERGGKLHPHHLKPKSLYPKLIFDLDNGITLCRECHKKTDTYGWKLYNVRINA